MAEKKRASDVRKGTTSRAAGWEKSGKSSKISKISRIAKPAASGRIAQLEAMVQNLRAKLVAEAQRRKLDQRVLIEAKRARDAVAKQLSALRAQLSKVTEQIKRAARENHKLEQARRAALAKVEELRAELHEKSEEVRRTSAELAKLARESATRARDIVHARGPRGEPHHEQDLESVRDVHEESVHDVHEESAHDDDPFEDDPFSGEKPPI